MNTQRRRSIRTKIAILLISFSLILGFSISVFSYYTARENYIDFFSKKTQESVRFVASLIDGDQISKYLQTNDTDEYYNKTLEMLNDMKYEQDLMYLYIFEPGESKMTYIMEAKIEGDEDDKIANLGDTYEYTEIEYKYLVPDVLAKKPSAETILGGDSFFGKSVSAWAPVLDSQGNLVAMVEADASLEKVTILLNNYILVIVMLIILIIFVMGTSLFFITKKIIINPINSLSQKMNQFVSGDELAIIENDLKTGDELQTLSETFCNMAKDIKTYMANLAQVTAERERVATELNVAKQIQASMLPCIFPAFPNRTEFDIYATMNPAKEVGGDFYDFFLIGEDKIALVMADVSGKGVPAALFMMISKALIKNLALTNLQVDEIFEQANNQLNENNDTFMFVTAFLGIVDLKTGNMSYVNAGHNPPLLRKSNGKFEWLEVKKNCILAVLPDAKFAKQTIQMNKGDMLFAYTDGVTEAIDLDLGFYTETRLEQSLNNIQACDDKNISEIVTIIRDSIDDFAQGAEQADDITILLFKYY